MAPQRLTEDALTAALSTVPSWSRVQGRDAIERALVFTDFPAALGFMTRVGVVAERMNHHPEWSNVYNRVHIVLSTHDCGGLSALDFELARYIDQVVD